MDPGWTQKEEGGRTMDEEWSEHGHRTEVGRHMMDQVWIEDGWRMDGDGGGWMHGGQRMDTEDGGRWMYNGQRVARRWTQDRGGQMHDGWRMDTDGGGREDAHG